MTDKKSKRRKHGLRAGILTVLTLLSLTACAAPFDQEGETSGESASAERGDSGFVRPGPNSYDSADTAVLTDRDDGEGTVTLLNLDLGRKYTLSIDGTTRFYDKYGESVSFDQIETGDIVDVTFLKSKKHLVSMRLASSAWSYSGVERYEINNVRGEVSIGSEIYKLTSNTQYVSGGRSIDAQDLNAADILSFQGIGSQILSVRVDKGHGYLKLVNDENFIGGWIEVGQTRIQRITADMLMLVPEGSYQVSISHKGGGGVKSVIINRNEETTLDIGDLEIPEPQYGTVTFSLKPASAELYIDGARADVSKSVELVYGIHQLTARADGYQSVTRYIRVEKESSNVTITLETDASEKKEESGSSGTSDDYKVYVAAPEGAEVYLDGNYVGISPCSFRKTAGTHVIILRRTGYETRSYTVQIDDEKKDLSYSFADLAAAGSSGATTSGNDQQ